MAKKNWLEEDLLFVLAVFTIAVFAVFLFFFSNEHVCGHFKNQQKVTLPTYKAIQKIGNARELQQLPKPPS